MNVFYLDPNPVQAARMHCLRHRNKMIVEYAQLLSTAHHELGNDDSISRNLYKRTRVNHPSAVWVRESRLNYDWVLSCAIELCDLFKRENWVQHSTYDILRVLHTYPSGLPKEPFSEPPVCAPDEFKEMHSTGVPTDQCYRLYMLHKYAEWQSRERPLSIDYFRDAPAWVKESGVNFNIVH